jgi:hypothetical protein
MMEDVILAKTLGEIVLGTFKKTSALKTTFFNGGIKGGKEVGGVVKKPRLISADGVLIGKAGQSLI